jgi:hypothetical protein
MSGGEEDKQQQQPEQTPPATAPHKKRERENMSQDEQDDISTEIQSLDDDVCVCCGRSQRAVLMPQYGLGGELVSIHLNRILRAYPYATHKQVLHMLRKACGHSYALKYIPGTDEEIEYTATLRCQGDVPPTD